MKKLNWEGVTPQTIARAAALLISLINMVLKFFNLMPIEISEDMIYNVVSALAVVVTAFIAFWKNNSFTAEAQEADKIMQETKKEGFE